MLWTRDFEYTMEFMLPLMDSAALAATHRQANYILDTRPVVTDLGPGDVTFRLNFHRFDRFELDFRGHIHVRGAALSCLRLRLADMVLI